MCWLFPLPAPWCLGCASIWRGTGCLQGLTHSSPARQLGHLHLSLNEAVEGISWLLRGHSNSFPDLFSQLGGVTQKGRSETLLKAAPNFPGLAKGPCPTVRGRTLPSHPGRLRGGGGASARPPGMQQRLCSSSLVFPGARRVGARASWKEGLVSWDGLCPGCSQQLSGSCVMVSCHRCLARGTTPCQFGGFFSSPQLSHDSLLTCGTLPLELQGC